jgi:cysteinyl-tRNA synthetase
MDLVLSLGLLEKVESSTEVDSDETAWIESQLVQRSEAKKSKDWAKADLIRDELKAKGITIIDTPQCTEWKKDN